MSKKQDSSFYPLLIILLVAGVILFFLVILSVTGILNKVIDSTASNSCVGPRFVGILILLLLIAIILIIVAIVVLVIFRPKSRRTIFQIQKVCNSLNENERLKKKKIFLKLQDEGRRIAMYFKAPPANQMPEQGMFSKIRTRVPEEEGLFMQPLHHLDNVGFETNH